MPKRIALLASSLLLAIITACGGPTVNGVVSVAIPGGDRSLALTASEVLTAVVTAGNGVATTVTWTSSAESVATVDSSGVVTANTLGTTTVTATSTVDATKTVSVAVTVVRPTAADGAFMASVTVPPGSLPLTGAALVLFSDAATALTSATVVEIDESPFFVGPVSPVGADGSVVVQLPPGSELPPEVLKTGETFIFGFDTMVDCAFSASSPGVKVTSAVFEYVTVPGVMLFGFGGTSLSVATDAPIAMDPIPPAEELSNVRFQTWVYAEADVSVVTTGTGCEESLFTLGVDVDLSQGWNQLAWRIIYDPVGDAITGVELSNSDAAEVFVAPMGVL